MSGGTDFFGGVIGSTISDSGGTAIHYDTNLPNIPAGDYIWFSAVFNNVKGLTSSQAKLYLTNSTITFNDSNNNPYSYNVSNAVVTLNSTSGGSAKTTYDLMNTRWSTSVPSGDLTGNTFATGIAISVPAGGFSGGIQNVQWSAAITTDTPNLSLQWQWNAAVYNSGFGAACSSIDPSNSGACLPNPTYAAGANTNALGVNPEDGSADAKGTDPAGTAETYKTDLTGVEFFSASGLVVPAPAPVSVSPSSFDFGTLTVHTSSGPTQVAVLTNNDTVSHTIASTNGITITGASDFTLVSGTGSCTNGEVLAANGGSCILYANFTANSTTSESAKIAVTDDAKNSPQTVHLTGTGQ
jgi:hypothetical protein